MSVTFNEFNPQSVTERCIALTDNAEENIQNIRKAVQLVFCIKLYKHFACQGPFKYAKESILFKQLKNVKSFATEAQPCSLRTRKRREVRIDDVNNGTLPLDEYMKKISTKVLEEIEEGMKKRIYNFWSALFTHCLPQKSHLFHERAPSWKTDLEKIDWSFTEFTNVTLYDFLTPLQNRIKALCIYFEEIYVNKFEMESPKEVLYILHDRVTEVVAYVSTYLTQRNLPVLNFVCMKLSMDAHLWVELRDLIIRTCKNLDLKVDETTIKITKNPEDYKLVQHDY